MVESRLSPDDVSRQEFALRMRGYDRHEVRAFLTRLGGELASGHDRERQLHERVAYEARQVPTDLGDDELLVVLGAENARVLHAAKETATEIVAQAEATGSELRTDGERERERARRQADELVAAAQAEAEATRAAAATEAEQRGAAEVEAARQRGREMIAEATTVRERILRDLARRRHVAHQQLEQLRAGRERLLEAYRVVRSTLDEATGELSVAEREARAAAESALLKVGPEVVVTMDQLEAEVASARDLGLTLGAPEPERVPAEAEADVVVEVWAGDVEEGARIVLAAAMGAAVEDESVVENEAVEVDLDLVQEELAEALVDARASALVPVGGARREEDPSPSQDEVDRPQSGVEQLFARIRADRESAMRAADAVLDEAVLIEEVPAADPVEATGEADEDAVEADEARPAAEIAFDARDAGLEAVESSLSRSMKRALADEQNELLDALRRGGRRLGLNDLLAERGPARARYAEAARPSLRDASVLGVRSWEAGDGAVAGAAEAANVEVPDVEEVVQELADRLVEGVRAGLEGAVEGIDDHETARSSAISSAYREWKSFSLDRLVRHALMAGHGRGRFLATPPGASSRWVVEDAEVTCVSCIDNSLAGPVDRGEVFPTGHLHPPAHDGCRCLVLPTDQ